MMKNSIEKETIICQSKIQDNQVVKTWKLENSEGDHIGLIFRSVFNTEILKEGVPLFINEIFIYKNSRLYFLWFEESFQQKIKIERPPKNLQEIIDFLGWELLDKDYDLEFL